MINRFFRRLARDKVDLLFVIIFTSLIVADHAGFVEKTDTMSFFAIIVLVWAVRLIMWHGILWEKVDKFVTDDYLRRTQFGLGAYDPRDGDYEQPKPLFVVIIDTILRVIIVTFVTFVVIQIIFFN
jgi:predicted membrane protein